MKLTRFATALACAALLGACSSPSSAPAAPQSAGGTAAAQSLDAAAADFETPTYTRIVAVTSETADMAMMLVGPENMAAISASSQNPKVGLDPDLAAKATNTLPPGVNPDAEQILAYEPDVVLLTARHGGEKSVGAQLKAAGVNVLEFSNDDFNTPERYAVTLREVGKTLGAPRKAERIAADYERRIADIDAMKGEKTPRTMALMARGGQVMAMGAENTIPALAIRAGGVDAAQEAGLTATAPIDAELVVRAAPDIVFVEDFMGAGMGPFQELLSNPALAEVPAVKNKRIVLLPMNEASAVAGTNLPLGYEKIMTEVHR